MFMPTYQQRNSFERDANRNDAATVSNTVANQGWKINSDFDRQPNIVGKTTNSEMTSNLEMMRQTATGQRNVGQDFSRPYSDRQRVEQDRQRVEQGHQRLDQDSVSSVRIPVQPAPHRAPSVNHWKPTSDLSV